MSLGFFYIREMDELKCGGDVVKGTVPTVSENKITSGEEV